MSSVAAFFVFLLIMLALATLAIILDWIGKPIRRSFRPRTSGTPGWLMVGTPMAGPDPAFLPPQRPDTHSEEPPAELPSNQPAGASAGPLPTRADTYPGPFPDQADTSPGVRSEVPGPWQAGDSIFKLTPRGTTPSITAVRRRYWKNLSERRASVVFGEANRELMAIGQAPQRFNPRTGTIEELSLPEPMLRHCWTTNRRPVPTWGDEGVDPFDQP
ncbi:hypothetical protein [Candidatus Poriferisocius sp.]|uniref:hypothetical protein n=1 Tax=Candidatus Poriferisocius sp. TaxID=3101276 RepID=UPI003B017D18